MGFEELIENLVFSATYPGRPGVFVVTADMLPMIAAYNWVVERLTERYGRTELRRLVLLLELSDAIAELRREASRTMAARRPPPVSLGYALPDTDKEGTCKVMFTR